MLAEKNILKYIIFAILGILLISVLLFMVLMIFINNNQSQPNQHILKKQSYNQSKALTPAPLKIQKIILPAPPAVQAPVTPLQPQQQVKTKINTNTVKVTPLNKTAPQSKPVTIKPLEKTNLQKKVNKPQHVKPLSKTVQKTVKNTQPNIKHIDTNMIDKGRVALKQIEKGQGPSIEIAFPDQQEHSIDLFNHLHQCYGMEVALLDNKGKLYHLSSQSGQTWRFNHEYYSQMLRAVSGRNIDPENDILNAIRQHHQLSDINTQPVRILPRQIDAVMIGGLLSLSHDKGTKGLNIKAHYAIESKQIYLHNIIINGEYFNDKIALTVQCV